MKSFDQPWQPCLDWTAPAGQILDKLVLALPDSRVWKIIVFGSSPLQLGIDSRFLSGDVDVISDEDITAYCQRAGLLKGQAAIYVEPCPSIAFTASLDWFVRAFRCQRQHVIFTFPHPIDILVSKVKRLEEKDLRAFNLVREKTGHPTEEDLILALRRVVDIFRPAFDEESAGDPAGNTRILWRELFGREIDVRANIIKPALDERRRAYGKDAAGLKSRLSSINPAESAILELPEVRRRVSPLSVEEYHRLGEYNERGKRTELIRGIVIEKMSKSPLHSTIVSLLYRLLLQRLPAGFTVRQEQPLTFVDSEPEPDISMTHGVGRDFLEAHPTTAELVIEVAVFNASLDRENASLYAEAGVKEYWIVLGRERQVEVYRRPVNGLYQETCVADVSDTLECSSVPGVRIQVAELFG